MTPASSPRSSALRLRGPSGWIDIDATFDRPLAAAGFLVHEG